MAETPQRPPSATIRERLIDAATEVFAEKGYDGTRVADIAKRAGLSTGAIYSQFENKSDLLLTALSERVAAESDQAYSRLRELPYEQALFATASRYSGPRAGLWLEALAAAERDESLAERLRDSLVEREQESIAYVERAQHRGLANPELSAAAVARLHMVLRIGSHVLTRLRVAPVDPAESSRSSARR